jgi:RNA polymerase sigma-70 factor (ECF subfamily)
MHAALRPVWLFKMLESWRLAQSMLADPATAETDDELMARMAADDRRALEDLYDRHAATVMGLAVRIVDDRGLAEEIVQETFFRVWKQSVSFDGARGQVTTWLFGIARNLAIDALRRRKVRPQPLQHETEVTQLDLLTDPADDPADIAWTALAYERVRQAMAELPLDQRRVLELAYFDGLTRQEIAQQLDAPLGTVHTRARLALGKLRDALADAGLGD